MCHPEHIAGELGFPLCELVDPAVTYEPYERDRLCETDP